MYMYKNDGYVRRYSESFKLKVLDELAKGNHSKSSNKPNLNLIKLLHLNPPLIELFKKLISKCYSLKNAPFVKSLLCRTNFSIFL